MEPRKLISRNDKRVETQVDDGIWTWTDWGNILDWSGICLERNGRSGILLGKKDLEKKMADDDQVLQERDDDAFVYR
ncbi:unnamed protein product [Cuscuta campestris]|uniref:Uncharacterized protein n=1 Tax=Cuscuta campestris TaxID=132261 RepID=A0A484NFG5_9ASTE|nr:unnamed protein product [Cuscuta campestris]